MKLEFRERDIIRAIEYRNRYVVTGYGNTKNSPGSWDMYYVRNMVKGKPDGPVFTLDASFTDGYFVKEAEWDSKLNAEVKSRFNRGDVIAKIGETAKWLIRSTDINLGIYYVFPVTRNLRQELQSASMKFVDENFIKIGDVNDERAKDEIWDRIQD